MHRISPRQVIAAGILVLLLFSGGGCAGGKKGAAEPVTLSAEEAYRRAKEQLAKRKLRQAISVLQKIQYTQESLQEIEPLSRLAMADATFYQGTDLAYIDARNMYLDFVTLYANHPMAPYAQVQAGFCSLQQVNHPSKDQSETHQAIADLREVERRFGDSRFAEAARSLLRVARSNLAESEFLVGRFYMKKKKGYQAAAERFRHTIDAYPDYHEMDKILFHLGRVLVLAENEVEGRIYLEQLVQDYPAGRYAVEARKVLGAAGGAAKSGGNSLTD